MRALQFWVDFLAQIQAAAVNKVWLGIRLQRPSSITSGPRLYEFTLYKPPTRDTTTTMPSPSEPVNTPSNANLTASMDREKEDIAEILSDRFAELAAEIDRFESDWDQWHKEISQKLDVMLTDSNKGLAMIDTMSAKLDTLPAKLDLVRCRWCVLRCGYFDRSDH